jgi:hypothetical protein
MSARVPEFDSGSPTARLAVLGITLPKAAVPLAAHVPAERTRARLPSLPVSAGASGLDPRPLLSGRAGGDQQNTADVSIG